MRKGHATLVADCNHISDSEAVQHCYKHIKKIHNFPNLYLSSEYQIYEWFIISRVKVDINIQ